jgi:hypothetical protein
MYTVAAMKSCVLLWRIVVYSYKGQIDRSSQRRNWPETAFASITSADTRQKDDRRERDFGRISVRE